MHRTRKVVGVLEVVALLSGLGACSSGTETPLPSSDQPTTGVAGGGSVPPPGSGSTFLQAKAVSAKSAAPVVGGTLLATRDGKIIAADPDRDTVFLVDAASHAVTPVPLQPGDEPGRVAEGADGTVYVALRRGGALVSIDTASATVQQRVSVCASPRGLAYDAKNALLHVACRSGELVTLRTSDLSIQRTLNVAPDLRDVIVRAADLVLTRFLSAEVLVVAPSGEISKRATPVPSPGCATATVLSRALLLPSGQIALAHQISSDEMVNVTVGGYGSSGCGGGLVSRAVSTVDVDTPSSVPLVTNTGAPSDASQTLDLPMTFQSQLVPAAGPIDVAFDATSSRFAMIAVDTPPPMLGLGGSSGPSVGPKLGGGSGMISGTIFNTVPGASLWLVPLATINAPAGFTTASSALQVRGQPVAVAFHAGSYVVQSREPATLEFEDGTSVALSSESHDDTGHVLFHMDTGIGISCSSCHPEGGEDGHVWHFPSGLRRTLPLQGGVMERAPFHWDGTLPDMGSLFSEVMVKRMNLQANVTAQQIATLGAFLEQLPEPGPAGGLDPEAVNRGAALFQRDDVGCASCHSGTQYTNNELSDVGTGGRFVTPSLLGVGLRSPLFHDGCAKSVAERFGPCGGTSHGKPALLSADEQADLIAFLRSL